MRRFFIAAERTLSFSELEYRHRCCNDSTFGKRSEVMRRAMKVRFVPKRSLDSTLESSSLRELILSLLTSRRSRNQNSGLLRRPITVKAHLEDPGASFRCWAFSPTQESTEPASKDIQAGFPSSWGQRGRSERKTK